MTTSVGGSSTPTSNEASLLRNPSSSLIQPSRPTTATTSSPPPSTSSSSRFLSASFAAPTFTIPPDTSSTVPLPNLLPVFSKYGSTLRGTVRIRVEATTFYCHREVLVLASPFFESLLSGNWKETAPRKKRKKKSLLGTTSVSSKRASVQSRTSVATSIDDEGTAGSPVVDVETSLERLSFEQDLQQDEGEEEEDSEGSEGGVAPSLASSQISSMVADSDDDSEDDDDDYIVCRLRLKEERASSFQDLLCHIYPRLECTISWQNASDLCKMASLFDIPSLRNACIAFLLLSAAGRPTVAMKIAEDNFIPELYKEASRYILDNFTVWPQEELAMLSQATLLKLERRRSWFLERLLKLGLIQTSKDYVCQATCPDPVLCARLVDEKWKTAWSSAFRFGTPQPSIIYRSLRNLEPSLSSPALHLPHTACQSHAKLYVADLFDRMFQQSIVAARNWGALSSTGRGGDAMTKNSARYFLSIEMDGVQKKPTNHGQHNSVAAQC